MISDKVTKVCFFEIVRGQDYWAEHGNRVDWPVEIGNHVAEIKKAAADHMLPGDFPTKPDPGSKRPERFLDIREGKDSAGVRAYAFRLNALVGDRQRLEFAPDGPFVDLPLNSSTNDKFLFGEPVANTDEPRRWACFVCDLDAVRASPLATRIRQAAEGEAHAEGLEHFLFLSIPFCLNLYDPALKAAPWVVPGPEIQGAEISAEDREEGSRAAKVMAESASPFFNHGGVHPELVAALKAGPNHGGVHPSLAVPPGFVLNHGGVHPSAASFLTVEL